MYDHDNFTGPAMTDSGTDAMPGTENARPGAGFFGGSGLAPSQHDRADAHSPMSTSLIPDPLQVKKPMSDEGSQTLVSGDEIESMLRDKNRVVAVPSVNSSPSRPNTAIGPGGRRSIDGAIAADTQQSKQPRRPASAGSMRGKALVIEPPLPEDHTEKIAKAGGKVPATPGPATVGTMGPPMMPASASRTSVPRRLLKSAGHCRRMARLPGPTERAKARSLALRSCRGVPLYRLLLRNSMSALACNVVI